MADNLLLLVEGTGTDHLLLVTGGDLLLVSSTLDIDYTNGDLQPSLWSADLATNLSLGSLEAADLQPSLWRADLQP